MASTQPRPAPGIEVRRNADGSTVYRAKVRMRGHPLQTATFPRLTDAKRWRVQTEAAIREGRHFKTAEAKRHTLAELVDRTRDGTGLDPHQHPLVALDLVERLGPARRRPGGAEVRR